MDQIKTGRFIAESRKELGLTQRQLADALSISDKTVSKWECGKGMPEVSLMLPLCEILHITVNDLLSGTRVAEDGYRKSAEENMMDLLRENQENRKRFVLVILCAAVTIVAVCALVAIAAFMENLPAAARIAVLFLALLTGIAGMGAATVLDAAAGHYECPRCKALFVPVMADYVNGVHTFTRRRLTCPKCGNRGMCRRRLTR